ncbi:hypothetical protein LOTGIDRAFT_166186 [Lottia gigantea]|uniref:CIDE-N domain-containing protein n=1 Tax=Lottia gigantea TaxID=225164 RepID=V4BH82_LOTGI|nr:hypothetical protein LOTGIDRAFT_166186 [Lottia gigantea]ESO87884.1 hypothetical protein LOTGIDRAFT_166186 [Lottia gigantea]
MCSQTVFIEAKCMLILECRFEPLTQREIIILSIFSSVVFLVLLVFTIFLIWYCRNKRRRNRERQEHLSRTLESISIRDPLEELVRRESRRSFYEDVANSNTENIIEQNDTPRKMFKIWTSDRQVKTYVFASEVQDILDQGATKLGLRYPSKLVLEEDGTEIDNDDILRACSGRILIILEHSERWKPRSVILNVDDLQHNNTNHTTYPQHHFNDKLNDVEYL